ncbi:UPF0711 protein C18orf21 [Camelus dromedarius]|uniref:UPF0711 protein C18orf21 n=1 Tax=Camelus dromedarius TaxID=9838 RepID=A0A5N4CHS7_CAMDR|nr:UPF0711 protein C18orf21 [Camelus dromedarius]
MRQKHYLEAAARKLQDSCPGQARYLLWAYSSSHGLPENFVVAEYSGLLNHEFHCVIVDDNSTFEETCPYCFQLLVLDNSRVRLKPKAKLTPKIQKLLNREARNYTLSFKEAKIVKKYKDSRSVLYTKHGFMFLFRTPTSGQSTPICSSKSLGKTKKHFSQLKMLLSQSESQKNPKVDFRNFLSSL